jgi:hypothetical protein
MNGIYDSSILAYTYWNALCSNIEIYSDRTLRHMKNCKKFWKICKPLPEFNFSSLALYRMPISYSSHCKHRETTKQKSYGETLRQYHGSLKDTR